MIAGLCVPLVLALIAGGVFLSSDFGTHAAAQDNVDCTLIVPANPLSAQGLATPYQLTATNPQQGACHEANTAQSAFVQAAILNPATGKISIYEPLVIDQGSKPAVQPTPPPLPARAVVGVWFGYNGNNLTLQKIQRGHHRTHFTLRGAGSGSCVNGTNGSVFGQFAYCNAPAFFQAANAAIRAGKLTVPDLGTGKDGKICPTARDFRIVDMDQSDNVQTQYLVSANGQVAQFSAANQAKMQNATIIGNPSDNALLTHFVDPALNCQPWQAPDLANNNAPVSALALDELQAAAHQQAPVALIPAGDPMVLNNGNLDLGKVNAYRFGVDQPFARTLNDANTTTYCTNLINIGLPSLQANMQLFQNQPSPDPGAANSLFTFLASRMATTLSANGLNCVGLLKIQNPITTTADANGVVTAATITLVNNPGTTPTPPATTGATKGNATFKLYTVSHSVVMLLNISYPNHARQQITVNVVPDSCTGKAIFTQKVTTDRQGNVNTFSLIRNVQGTTLPTNWFFTVTDPALTGNQTVGCSAVAAKGVVGTATLTITTTSNTPVPATPTATPQPAVTPTAAATNNGTTATPTATVATTPTP